MSGRGFRQQPKNFVLMEEDVGLCARVGMGPWYRVMGWEGLPGASKPRLSVDLGDGPYEITSERFAWEHARG